MCAMMKRVGLGGRFWALMIVGLGLAVAKADEVKVLSVGNSFSRDATRFLEALAGAGGKRLLHAPIVVGGASLELHATKAQKHEEDGGSAEGLYADGKSLKHWLREQAWDVVTIQQASIKSHDYETFQPHGSWLADYVQEHAPSARLWVHQTWAYRCDDPRFVKPAKSEKEPLSRAAMHAGLAAAYRKLALDTGAGLIPVGAAFDQVEADVAWGYRADERFDFKAARAPTLPDQSHSLHLGWRWVRGDDGEAALRMDGHHASVAGQYLGACVWYEVLFGSSCVGLSFVAEGLSAEHGRFLQEAAHRAVKAEVAMTAAEVDVQDDQLTVAVDEAEDGELVLEVKSRAELNEAVGRLRAGVTVRLMPGEYGNGFSLAGIKGSAEQPVVIEGAPGLGLPTFTGGQGGIHLAGGEHIVLRRLAIRGSTVNGLNVDDGGKPGGAQHITIEGVEVAEIGPEGNYDGIKLSGLQQFVVTGCKVRGWGGQAVDLVGCRAGVIERCVFEGREGFSQSAGVQMKGGSEDIVVRRCEFKDAGERPVNLGGSTGRAFFRPLGANYEGRRLVVEDCLFVGGQTSVAFVGCEESIVRFNTFIGPERWALRILQENTEHGMVPCRNNLFERNLIVAPKGRLRAWVNVGVGAEGSSFQFTENWWYGEDVERAIKLELPAVEVGGIYEEDPQVKEENDWRPSRAEALGFGVRNE